MNDVTNFVYDFSFLFLISKVAVAVETTNLLRKIDFSLSLSLLIFKLQ